MAWLESLQNDFWSRLVGVLGTIGLADIVDILLMSVVVYYAIRLVRETRAMQLVRSIVFIMVIYLIAEIFSLITLRFVLSTLLDYGLVVLVVLFQPELRRAMEHIGRNTITDFVKLGGSGLTLEQETMDTVEEICDACDNLSARMEGALIVIERETKLGDIITTGTMVDAHPSSELICNLFFKNSPLHDGAMIIRDNRVYAAGCFLPLSGNDELSKELGTRHRAALGVSEVSDAITIVVSEERGSISVAMESRLQRDLSVQNLRRLLQGKLVPSMIETKKRRFLPFGKKKAVKPVDSKAEGGNRTKDE